MAEQEQAPERLGTLRSLAQAVRSWRTLSVVLLSFSSGMPLGLVWIAIPDWMRDAGIDIRLVGLFTLAQAPWTFNVVWAPLMDRFPPPFLGRRRGWAAIAQVGLLLGTLGLSGVGDHPDTPWLALALTLAIAMAAASQDIAVDAYAVDVLRKEEQGAAVGARIGLYRLAMLVAGGTAISVAGAISWPLVCVGLAALYLPMLAITILAPEPKDLPPGPKTLRDAVWQPFLGFLSRHRAVEILAFVILFKFGDNLAQGLLRPFLVDMGYSEFHRGVALATVGTTATIVGSIAGGLGTNVIGLGRALWIFGFLQIFSNVGYILLANLPMQPSLLYGAMGFESLCQGLGTGAFSVLLLRMTQKRFSATQYALFSTLFGMGRIVSGPIAGFMVHSIGWSNFFLFTIPLGLPGLYMLSRFVRPKEREPKFEVRRQEPLPPRSPAQLATHGLTYGTLTLAGGALLLTGLAALEAVRDGEFADFGFGSALLSVATPSDMFGWIQLAGLITFGVAIGLFAAAVQAARHGAGAALAAASNEP
ncbi:MAG: MFS transporter [Acidobacteria bacterium]|nr:MFS transporter [Acidobacteriota bacterium]